MEFLNYFGRTKEDQIIVFDIFTFNNLFSLLLYNGFSHQDAISFILSNCSINVYVFQKCIHNSAYLNLKPKNMNFTEAGRRSVFHQMALSYMIDNFNET